MWFGQGITSLFQLDAIAWSCILSVLVWLYGSFYHFHGSTSLAKLTTPLAHLTTVVSLGSVSWSSHLFHVAVPVAIYVSLGCVFTGEVPARHFTVLLASSKDIYGLELAESFYTASTDSLVLAVAHHLGLAMFGLLIGMVILVSE